MILCVTLNPCLDKTLTVPAWSPGDNVRGTAVREVVGGKGNNVARALKRLGRSEVRPATFLGGAVGRRCAELFLRDDAMDALAIPTEAPTREILTVRTEGTDAQSAFFDPDPAIAPEEAGALLKGIDAELASGRVEALTLSGSSPSPATHEVFAELIALANARRVPAFLDTYGPPLKAIWGFWPVAVQMNLREAGIYLGLEKRRPTDAEILGLLDRWRGSRVAVVTDGPNRFLARVGRTHYRVTPPAIEPVNPIGSGDCFLAGIIDATLTRRGGPDLLRHAVGCAVANALVWDAGGLDPESARAIASEVAIEPLGA